MTTPRQHLLRLVSENVQRVRLIDHTFDPSKHVVVFRGRNEQGKTSFVDTFAMTALGKNVQPPRVIREGERQAVGLFETEDLIAERVWKKKLNREGVEVVKDEIEVRGKESGEPFASPQKLLDGLISAFAFDALEFMRMKPAEQLEVMKRLVGINFAELDTKRAEIFEARKLANRDVVSLQKRLEALPAGTGKIERLDVAALLGDREVAQSLKTARIFAETQVDNANRSIEAFVGVVARAAAAVKEAEAAWARANATLKTAKADEAAAREHAKIAVKKLEASPGPGPTVLAELATKIATASSHNERVAKLEERATLALELKAAESKADGLTAAIAEVDAQKEEIIKSAKFPVPGLGLTELGVTFNGLPLEQASGAGKIRLGVAIGFALNPSLKVIRVRHGGDLDPDSMQLLEQLATEADGLVLVECGNGKDGPGIVIEDGAIESIDGVKVDGGSNVR